MLRAILFDLDGVLVDSFESNFRYSRDVFAQAGYKPLTRKQFRDAFHLTLDEMICRYMSKGDPVEFRRVYRIAFRLYQMPEIPKLQAGSLAFLRKYSKDFMLGIVTGRLKEGVDEYLDSLPVRGIFKAVIHFGKYDNPKPNPEPIMKALDKLKVDPGETVYVGDALTDIKAAKAAKVTAILFNAKKLGRPDFHAKSFPELERIIRKISYRKTAR